MLGGGRGLALPSYVATVRSVADMSRVHDALRRLEHTRGPRLSTVGLDSEHWMLAFLEELLGQFRSSGEISFEDVQGLLRHHQQVFLRDLAIARRMYRTYPRFFKQDSSGPSGESKTAQA